MQRQDQLRDYARAQASAKTGKRAALHAPAAKELDRATKTAAKGKPAQGRAKGR